MACTELKPDVLVKVSRVQVAPVSVLLNSEATPPEAVLADT